ncbi:MAG: hypothetical protein LT071_11550 [Nocardioides sp.]|nr:hypothetical protein [Nocardioides sp.]
MFSALFAPACAVGGGLLWLVPPVLGADGTTGSLLHAAGLVLLLVAVALWGSTLVASTIVPLRVVVAVATALLAWSLVELVRPAAPDWYDQALGVVAVLVGVAVGVRARGREREAPARRGGAHAR